MFVIGASGSGKTTLAMALAQRNGFPVVHLDMLAGRPSWFDRAGEVRALAARETWIAEGLQLGWTEPFLERADLILWLDHVSSGRSTVRVIHRFLRGGIAGIAAARSPGDLLRVGQRARHARDLLVAMVEVRRYHRQTPHQDGGTTTNAHVEPTRDMTARALAHHRARLVSIRRQEDIDLLLTRLKAP